MRQLAPSPFCRYTRFMKKRSVVVIGAGIAGLSAAVYLQRSGFDVTIYEQHEIPGGLSTSWSRKGYLFEGGMHWLTGSSEKLVLNRVWKETGALKENNPVRYREPLYTLIDEKTEIRLYRDIDKMRKEFIDAAPEDRKAIEGLCRDIKTFLPVHFVLRDIPWIKTKSPTIPTLKELLPMAPAAIPALYLRNVSYDDYLSRFKNKKLRALLHSVIGTRFNALSLVYTLASFASGDCGYPEGGSLRLAQNIADTFASLGGKIVYRTKVLGIVTEGRRISGVKIARTKAGALPYTADGFDHPAENSETEIVKSDFVVAAFDTRRAVDSLFAKPLEERWAKQMRKIVTTEQNMFIALGIKADLSNRPTGPVLLLDEPLEAAGLRFTEIRLNNYAGYANHAPEGCTALTCLLLGGSYDWWKAKKADGTYRQCKKEIIDKFIKIIESRFPETKGAIEVTDMATPLTYERYTASFEGSWMSVWKPRDPMFILPAKSKTVRGLYFASERSMMPGGLIIAGWAGRRAAQTICKDTRTEFIAHD